MKRLALAALMAAFSFSAQAKWKPEYAAASPELRKWYAEQHNSKGGWCCDEADAEAYHGDYRILDDGSVELTLEGKPYVIDAYKVLNTANPTGHPVWWHVGSMTYCFAPGSLG